MAKRPPARPVARPTMGSPTPGVYNPAVPPPVYIPPATGGDNEPPFPTPGPGGPTTQSGYPPTTPPTSQPATSEPPATGDGPDWSSYLDYFGFDNNTKQAIQTVWAQYGPDQQKEAIHAAIARIRGTPWYATHFAGIREGVARGLISPGDSMEIEYRTLLGQYNDLTRRYAGREVAADEFANALRAGVNAPTFEKQLARAAYGSGYDLGIVTNDAQYRDVYGQYAALTRAYDGSTLGADTFNYLLRNGVSIDQYEKQLAQQQYGVAYTRGTVRNLAEYRALQGQFNQVAQQYTGAPLDEDAYSALIRGGTTLPQYQAGFAGKAYTEANAPEIQYQAGAFTPEGQLTPEEMTAYGQEKVGYDTPLGAKVQARIDQAMQRYRTLFSGQLAVPGLTLGPAGLRYSGTPNPDVGQ